MPAKACCRQASGWLVICLSPKAMLNPLQSLLLAVFPAGSPTLWFLRILSLVCGLLMWPCGQAIEAFPYPGSP